MWLLKSIKISKKREKLPQLHILSNKLFELPQGLSKKQRLDIFEEYFTFVFVRHPFDRLASAYQDKVLDTNYAGWHKKIPKNYTREPKDKVHV